MVQLILLVAAFILLLLEAFTPYWLTTTNRPHLGWLGMALWALSILLAGHV